MSKWSQADALDLAIDSRDYREIEIRDTLACASLSDDVAVRDRAMLLTALETLADECADRLSESSDEVEDAEKRADEAEARLEEYLQGADGARQLEAAIAERDEAQRERDEGRAAIRSVENHNHALARELSAVREKLRALQDVIADACAKKAPAPKRSLKGKKL